MNFIELRKFIKVANAEKLTPAEKDVFLYYVSSTGNENGRWHCPDEEVAEKIGRSRSGVCEARQKLKLRGWIEEKYAFSIRVLKTFAEIIGQLQAEKGAENPQSEVGNSTAQSAVRIQSQDLDSPVGNSTAYKDKGTREENKKREEPATQTAAPSKVVDPVSRRIWTDGLDLLKSGGIADHSARSLLGKLGKEYGRELLGECIAATQAANPVNPDEFLIGTLKNRKNGNANGKSNNYRQQRDEQVIDEHRKLEQLRASIAERDRVQRENVVNRE